MSEPNGPAPFGVNPDSLDCYKLIIRPDGLATLMLIDPAGEEDEVASGGLHWRKLTSAAEADWNERLEAKGQSPGRMPSPSEAILLHRQFGRELQVLFEAVTCFQEAEEGVRLWRKATPAWRKYLWGEIAELNEGLTTMPDICGASMPQVLLEALRKRAADGSIDESRAARIDGSRKAAIQKINAARRASKEWRAAPHNPVVWSRR